MAEKIKRIVNGREVSQKEWDALPSKLDELFATGIPPGGPSSAGWPLKSDAMAVHPLDVPAMIEKCKLHGVSATYDDKGRPEFSGPIQRRDYARKFGVRDNNGGYLDP